MLARRIASLAVPVVLVFSIGACGPDSGRECVAGVTDLLTDPFNCGTCGNVCADGYSCVGSQCIPGECQPGTTEECYTAPEETLGVGPCTAGTRTCDETATWSRCSDVTPVSEGCSMDGVDDDCNGVADDGDLDTDADGFTACGGDCCDNTGICTKPELANPGAFDAAGNEFDDDCNGVTDDTLLLCDQGIPSNTTNGMDFARAIDICQVTTDADPEWGVITATLTLADGTGIPDPEGHAVRPRFGTGAVPQGGVNLAILSAGGAAAKTDVNPGFHDWSGYSHAGAQSSPIPADFLAANGGALPNAPGCPAPFDTAANDPVMLTLRVRVPTNARSFKLSTNFFSAEFPEYTCSTFNDFFVVLLDSTYAGDPPNPPDKNLAFYQPAGTTTKVPVGVNLGTGNTGLFTQCVNGNTGCSGTPGSINTCVDVSHLGGTGFDDPQSGSCDTNSLKGGATGWLVTSGNVTPGEIITLRIAIWDTGDHILDSLAVVDGFQWSTEVAQPGTVIFTGHRPDLPVVQRDYLKNILKKK